MLIGTVFVLASQALQEALALYSRGSALLYRKIAFLHNIVYNVAVLVAAALAVPLYTTWRQLPMIVAAALLVPVVSAFTAFYVLRLRALPTGIFGGLEAGERELAARHAQTARATFKGTGDKSTSVQGTDEGT